MRRKVTNRNIVKPDIKFDSTTLEKFINSIMMDGKKNTARTVVYGALEIVKEKEGTENPLEVFDNALKNVALHLQCVGSLMLQEVARV